ncbi:MAG: sodium:calcium antiporter [Archaeoglobaceae archaeon]
MSRGELRNKIIILFTLLLTVPWFFIKLMGIELYSPFIAFFSGLCVVAAGFLLAWSCETAEMDVPKSLAVAVVALIAVLPEYAVDGYLAWMAGKNPEYIHYAIANMTGANRLLIGIGWSSVALFAIWKRLKAGSEERFVSLKEGLNLELFFLMVATVYAFTLPFKAYISVLDAVVLISLYVMYAYLCFKSPIEPFEAVGVTEYLCSLPARTRKFSVVGIMAFSAFAILVSVEAFAESLIHTGKIFDIDSFLMVQWVAPLASEAPEFTVALIFVSKMRYNHSLNVLISSKVNQWTLLLGSIPVIYSISVGEIAHLPFDHRHVLEVLLTASQSIFAAVLILNRRFSVNKALLLLALFLIQFAIPTNEVRLAVSLIYLAILIPVAFMYRDGFRPMFSHIRGVIRR